MLDTLRTGAAFIIALGVLIFIHELGHYFAARARGVVVEVFSIGFGPALLKWQAKSGTVWQISALPLGGYVKMQGWGEEEDGKLAAPGSFSAASLGSKAIIVAAGPLANLALAFVLFAGLFMAVGQVVTQPVLSQIVPNSPAAAAHLQAGDRVLDIGATPISDFAQMQNLILAHPDTLLDFTIMRGTQKFTQSVTLGDTKVEGETVGHLGVVGTDSTLRRYTPPAAIAAAAQQTGQEISAWVTGIATLIVDHKGLKDLSGPLGIAQITGQAAAMGIASLVGLIALLSINLGLVNLIPIPMLDGGHLFFYAIEAIIRRPVPAQAREVGLRFGVAVIFSLFLLTTFNDLTRLGAFAWFTHLL
jgi:regulator of sigma E protease